jgi:hypothetical protein
MARRGAHNGTQLLQNSAAALLDEFAVSWKEVIAYNIQPSNAARKCIVQGKKTKRSLCHAHFSCGSCYNNGLGKLVFIFISLKFFIFIALSNMENIFRMVGQFLHRPCMMFVA